MRMFAKAILWLFAAVLGFAGVANLITLIVDDDSTRPGTLALLAVCVSSTGGRAGIWGDTH